MPCGTIVKGRTIRLRTNMSISDYSTSRLILRRTHCWIKNRWNLLDQFSFKVSVQNTPFTSSGISKVSLSPANCGMSQRMVLAPQILAAFPSKHSTQQCQTWWRDKVCQVHFYSRPVIHLWKENHPFNIQVFLH